MLLLGGVVVRPAARRVVGGPGPLFLLLAAGSVTMLVSGAVSGDLPVVAAGAVATLLFGGVLTIAGFRIDATGITPQRPLWSTAEVRYRWDEVAGIRLQPEVRTNGVLVPELRSPRTRVDRAHPSMFGTTGLLRSARPLRILAAAAALGLLPPWLPVTISGQPRLPSTRAAMRLLRRHHPSVTVW